ncbi:hypothetical protein [Polaromonas sp.]|uniref:hypothetical protein n=1 Tax=Polaromonas sp. TaxID=1869339 RepID=UPI003BADB550
MTRLHIGATLSAVRPGGCASEDSTLSLPIGFLSPGHALKHQPPTPLELENAIATIEDIVMPLARSLSPSTQLVTADPIAQRLYELAGSVSTQDNSLGIVAVEALFNEMVDVSQGRPSAGSPFLDTALCGYLLILREFMHHLAFGDVLIEATNALMPSRNQ